MGNVSPFQHPPGSDRIRRAVRGQGRDRGGGEGTEGGAG